MTVIVAKKYKNKIEFAADSFCGIGWGAINQKEILKVDKLFQVNDITCGVTGNLNDSNLFRLYCNTHRPESEKEIDMYNFMSAFTLWTEAKKVVLSSTFLIAFKDRLFQASSSSIYEVESYHSIGAGEQYARTCLFLGKTPKEAVRVACQLSCYCADPIISISHRF